MITTFDSLYAGHVDMDDIGYGGAAVNGRVFPNEHLVTAFSKARNLARLLDRCGYDTFWPAEHHFQREGYECLPNVLLLALDLAHQTKRLKMGCGFNIAPMWHPLRLAEDFAAVDVSFISLKLVLPAIGRLLLARATIVALIKPQFEAARAAIKKGIVRDPAVHQAVCDDIAAFFAAEGWRVGGVIPSPIPGGDGNREFLIEAERG